MEDLVVESKEGVKEEDANAAKDAVKDILKGEKPSEKHKKEGEK